MCPLRAIAEGRYLCTIALKKYDYKQTVGLYRGVFSGDSR